MGTLDALDFTEFIEVAPRRGNLLADLSPENPEVYLPTVYEDEPQAPSHQFPWPPKFCLDLALGFDSEETLLLKYSITAADYERFKRLPAFRRDLAMAMTTIREEGLTFKSKCRVFAEEYLDEIYLQLFDPKAGITNRFDMFKQLVKLGGLEPKEEKTGNSGGTDNWPRVNIQINL